jgi:uncharacterized protein (TIGR02594 family)
VTDAIPLWLVTARTLKGTDERPGSLDNPTILGWSDVIARKFPKMAAYARSYSHDAIAWCGHFAAYCMAANGISPPFGATDTDRYLWARAWASWGTRLLHPKPGCIMVFSRSGGGHVAFFERESDTHYYVTGGNQSDTVSTTAIPKGNLVAMRWPSEVQQETSPMPSGRFEECLAVTLKWEGGNDDDPRDPGGRTSRGILQSEWNAWRQSHPGLPSDVWEAPQGQIVAIYKEKYWDRMLCDQMPAGVDLAVFDFGVNSGRGVSVVQDVVGTDADGEVGPLTLAALSASPPADLIARICDARMAYLRGLSTWGTFGRGWTNRVNDVRAQALAMATLAPPIPVIVPVPAPLPTPTPIPPPTLPSGDIPDYERLINFIAANRDDIKLLLRFLGLSGAPTAVSVAPLALPSPEPSPVATALSRPSVVGGASLTAAAATAQATGALPMPTDLVTALPLLIPAGTALVGSLGGWGALAGIAANVFSAMAPKK